MRKIILLCVAVFLFISALSWAQNPINIKGWNKTSWGMNEDNLIELFPGQITRIAKQEIDHGKIYCNLKLTNYKIGDTEFDVLFGMSAIDNKLKHVRLVCNSALPLHFSQFEQLLIDKYGQPQSKEALQGIANSYDKIDSWSLPSTKIELTFSYAVGSMGILNIIYSDQILRKEKLDKL